MEINEIIIISGKGGTGKTTLTASMIPYFNDLVIADCDVDAPDLDILFDKEKIFSEDFVGLQKAVIDKSKCINCGICAQKCNFDSIDNDINLNPLKCEGCGLCEFVCPQGSIEMKDWIVGKLFTSATKYGDMVHARLIPGEETSGKLVSEVRKKAKKIAKEKGKTTILVDGSPGIACNVISSITGAKHVIIVTEPTFSGLHDLKRVYKLTQKFRLNVSVVINKYSISEIHSKKIEDYCSEIGVKVTLKIPFQEGVVKSISNKKIPSLDNKELFDNINFKKFIEDLKN